jgi:tetratricopeptide (TPR) repeat protein
MSEPHTSDSDNGLRFEAAEEGAELIREGEVDAAIEELTRLITDDPNNEYAHFFLGNAYFEREDFARALKAHVRALELAPRYLGAMIGAGQALRMMGRLDQALRMGKQALLLAKDDPDALYLLGLVHFQRDDKKKAAEYFERFLETQPELEVAYEVRGMLQVLKGDIVPMDAPPGSDETES